MTLGAFSSNEATPIKVMIVDDSAVIRNILSRVISTDSEIEVVAAISSAKFALENVNKFAVEVIVLDIEMPGMTGIEAIPEFLKINPKVKILMVSTLTTQNAPITLKALSLGAADYLEKPTALDINSSENFKLSCINKIKALGYSYRSISANIDDVQSFVSDNKEVLTQDIPKFLRSCDIKLRSDRMLNFYPSVIAIASSTGGPKAVMDLLKNFRKEYLQTVPILITQHMPKVFTKLFAENIDRLNVLPCKEAEDGEEVEMGKIYVAPGGFHMEVEKKTITSKINIRLKLDPPVNFCRPAADPMLYSICETYKDRILLIVLTGMGHDGLDGARKVVNKNGIVIAQDEKSSVVWGMPGNVAVSNLCTAVLPIEEIAGYVMQRGK